MTWRSTGPDAAVSEVVGYVLVTGITVVAITLVVMMSGPTLDRIQSDQAHDSMVGYFHDLDQSFSKILSGSPTGSTPLWRVALPGGASVSVTNGPGHMWAYAVDHDEDRRLFYGGFDDGDETFTVKDASGSVADPLGAEAWSWDGTDSESISVGVNQESSSEWTVTLGEDLVSNTVEIVFSDNAESEFSRVWIVDGGSVVWTQPGSDPLRILYQNTGIISLRDGGEIMQNTPRIPAPQTLEEDDDGEPLKEHVFVRLTKVEGAVSIGGQTSATLLVSSDGTNVRHSTASAERVQLYPPTSATTAWQRYFNATDDATGFDYTWDANPEGLDIPVYYKDKSTEDDGELHVTMLQTEITLGLRGGV